MGKMPTFSLILPVTHSLLLVLLLLLATARLCTLLPCQLPGDHVLVQFPPKCGTLSISAGGQADISPGRREEGTQAVGNLTLFFLLYKKINSPVGRHSLCKIICGQ